MPRNNPPEFNWRNDASARNKRRAAAKYFASGIPPCLWYWLGEAAHCDDVELFRVAELLFTIHAPDVGDIERRESRFSGEGMLLRVRGAAHWEQKLVIGGHDCHLIAIGHEFRGPYFNFSRQWDFAQFRPGTCVVVRGDFASYSFITVVDRQNPVFLPEEIFTVVETRWDDPLEQAKDLAVLACENPALAHYLMHDGSKVPAIFCVRRDTLEVITVTDAKGKLHHFPANMFQETE